MMKMKLQSTVLFGVCLVGALGLFSLTGCGDGGEAGSIKPPESRPSEYAASEKGHESGAVPSGKPSKKKKGYY